MAKANGRGANKQGRSEGAPPFVQIPWWVMESPAFHALSPEAVKALLYLTKRFNGINNGHIVFGVRAGGRVRNPGQPEADAKDRPIMSRRLLARALSELAALRLVEATKASSFGQKKLAREWRLTWLPRDGKAATREFMTLSERECAEILAELKTKASHSVGTAKRRIVTASGQSDRLSTLKAVTQSRRRDYDAHTQSQRRDTSSNHPSGESYAGVIAA